MIKRIYLFTETSALLLLARVRARNGHRIRERGAEARRRAKFSMRDTHARSRKTAERVSRRRSLVASLRRVTDSSPIGSGDAIAVGTDHKARSDQAHGISDRERERERGGVREGTGGGWGTDGGNLEEAERSSTPENTLTHCVPLHF